MSTSKASLIQEGRCLVKGILTEMILVFIFFRLPSTWISPTHFVFQSDDGGLAILNTANDTVSVLVTNHTLVSTNFASVTSCRVKNVA